MPKRLKTKDIFYSYEVDVTELQSSYFYENLWYDTEDYKRTWTLHCAFSAGVWFASVLLGIFVYDYCALLIIPAMLWYHYSNWQYQNWKTQARQYTTLIGRADMYQWRLLNTKEFQRDLRHEKHNRKQGKKGPFCGKSCSGKWSRQKQLASMGKLANPADLGSAASA